MKALWILAAAASLAACHHQTEDEMGAAPQRDTTAVTRDTTAAMPADTTQVTQPTAPAPTPADTGMKMDTTSVNPNAAPAPTPSPTDTSGAVPAPSVDTSSSKTSGDSGYSK